MIFRWSIWGDHKQKSLELLKYSILSFKKYFGDNHDYVIYTDTPDELFGLEKLAKVWDFTLKDSPYNLSSKATWKKWCPEARLNINETEFYVDSDVFLVDYPKEVDYFLGSQDLKFAIMDEFKGQSWQHGSMQIKADNNTPFVNAGFFIQKAGYSISDELLSEFVWWKSNIKKENQTHHDEQGALAIVLSKYLQNNELYIFPKDKYMLIGPNENKDIESLDNVVLFHAVYPEHPAFYKFKNYLDDILR